MGNIDEVTDYLFREIIECIENETSPVVCAKLATFLAYRNVELDEGWVADEEVMRLLDKYEVPYEDSNDGTRHYLLSV